MTDIVPGTRTLSRQTRLYLATFFSRLLDQLAAQREQITRLDTREATHYATLTGLLAGLTARTGPAPDDPSGYQPDPAPAWWQLSPEDRQQPVARLRAWVEQVYRPGYGHLAA